MDARTRYSGLMSLPAKANSLAQTLDFSGRTLVMGIVNVTPDSFSDGGRFFDPDAAVAHAVKLAADGADILDFGAQSTRPGSASVGADEELRRLLPVLKGLADRTTVPISVDTTESTVASEALAMGVCILNDISALRADPDMVRVAADAGCGVILMHMQGTPATMQVSPHYDDVVAEVHAFLRERIDWAVDHGIASDRIIADVGIGFGKTSEHNLLLIKEIEAFFDLGVPILMAHSRKRFLAATTGLTADAPADRRDGATLAISAVMAQKRVHLVRVHDVVHTRHAIDTVFAIQQGRIPSERPITRQDR